MLLLTAATEEEIHPVRELLQDLPACICLVTGVGCLESAVCLCRFLDTGEGRTVRQVVNFGVAGAFTGTGVNLLDICLAEEENLADFGICINHEICPFEQDFGARLNLPMDAKLRSRAAKILTDTGYPFHSGPFVLE